MGNVWIRMKIINKIKIFLWQINPLNSLIHKNCPICKKYLIQHCTKFTCSNPKCDFNK